MAKWLNGYMVSQPCSHLTIQPFNHSAIYFPVSYDIIESDFNKKLSTAYQLSIIVGEDSLSYFVFDTGSDRALLLKTYQLRHPSVEPLDLKKELSQTLHRDELMAYLFRRVKIILPTTQQALVPERLYDDNERATYLGELSEVSKDAAVLTDELGELGARVVYTAEPALMALLKKQFPTGRFYAPATPFLLGCRKLMEDSPGFTMFVNVQQKNLAVALFEKQKLQFFNTFPCTGAPDVLYYTLLTYNQFGLDATQVPLNLSGAIIENSDIYKLLFRYIQRLNFLGEPPFLKFGRKFDEVPPHFFFELYALAVCK